MTRISCMYALASITLGLLLGFMGANFKATGVSAAAGPSSLAAQQGEDKPVEQTKKNIQVLKGLPTSQLMPLMNLIAASLGVKCDHCHVLAGKNAEGFNNWIWESDDKETKRTARRMMQMVLSINNTNRADFRDGPVTCYTCHRGQKEPVGLPSLPLAVSAHEDGGPPASARPTAASLPTVEQVMNKYVAAVGGREAAAKLQSTVLKGSYEQSQGRNPVVEINIKRPDKYLIVLNTKQQGVIYQATNGATGWARSSRGQQEMNATELARLKQAATLYNVIKVAEPYTGMTVTGTERIGDREAYVLERGESNGRTEKLFFDTETGLLLRRVVLTGTVLLPIPEQTDFEDYREVDGVKLPYTIRTSNIDTFFSVTRKFTEIKNNVPLDDARFNPPPAPAAPAPQKP
ncbi:MAG TPA: c-type cytochrome [Pyrinomonadaceae bacterium]